MIRWRVTLALVMLLLIPAFSGKRDADDDDDEKSEDNEEEEEEEDEDDDDDDHEKNVLGPVKRLGAPILTSMKPGTLTRTTKRRPLECYVCAFKSEAPLRACLDPTKYRVHTITCHSTDDKCFTSVVTKGNSYEAVVRGCRSSCIGAPDTTCCEINRCNSQAFAMPMVQPRVMLTSKSIKTVPGIFFFVTILLLLQTVVKVAFV